MTTAIPITRRHRTGPGLAPVIAAGAADFSCPALDGWTPSPEADAPLPEAARERVRSLGHDLDCMHQRRALVV